MTESPQLVRSSPSTRPARRRPALAAAALIALPATILAGCAGTGAAGAGSPLGAGTCSAAQSPSDGTVVIAATASSAEPRPALPSSVLADLDRDGQRDDACVLIVGPDRRWVSLSLTPHRPNGQVERGPRREAMLQERLTAVQRAVGELSARSAGNDPRGLLSEVRRIHPAATRVYLITSGVSTAEPVNLVRLGWGNDGGQIAAALRGDGWLPDLSGWRVELIGLGEVAGSQPPLPDPVRGQLVRLWTDLCQATGATCTALPDAVGTVPPLSTNLVPVVPLPHLQLVGTTVWVPAPALFTVGSAELAPSADSELVKIVDQARTQRLQVTITGHTDASTGTSELNQRLSTARALAVRDRLVALGLPAEQIVAARGTGSAGFSADQERRDLGLIDRHRSVEIAFSKGV